MWLYTSQLATTIMWLSCQSFTDWRFPNIMTLASYFPAPSMQWCSDALLRFGKSFGENKLTATFWLRHKNSLCGSPSCHRCFPFRYRGSPCGAAFCWRTKMSLFFLEQIMVNWIVDRKFKKKKKKTTLFLLPSTVIWQMPLPDRFDDFGRIAPTFPFPGGDGCCILPDGPDNVDTYDISSTEDTVYIRH